MRRTTARDGFYKKTITTLAMYQNEIVVYMEREVHYSTPKLTPKIKTKSIILCVLFLIKIFKFLG